jgi:hypothetical protein
MTLEKVFWAFSIRFIFLTIGNVFGKESNDLREVSLQPGRRENGISIGFITTRVLAVTWSLYCILSDF